MNNKIILIICLLFIFASCTENPLDDKNIMSTKRQLKGNIKLSDNNSPEGVYVWLESYNIGTFTDKEGSFKLLLPPSAGQGSSDGVDGTFNLYYYVANYQLLSSKVVIQNGNVASFEGDENHDGELENPVFLGKILKIKSTISPKTISLTNPTPFTIKVTLESLSSSVQIYYPGVVDGKILPLSFRNLETNKVSVLESTVVGILGNEVITLGNNSYDRQMVTNLGRGDMLEQGEFEVIPYLLINNDTVPKELYSTLGVQNPPVPGDNFLKIPITVESDKLKIIP